MRLQCAVRVFRCHGEDYFHCRRRFTIPSAKEITVFARLRISVQQPIPKEQTSPNGSTVEKQDLELDNLCHILKEYGRNAFDIDISPSAETREMCEKWVMHLQYGAPQPGATDSGLLSDNKKDWSGLRGFFSRHRQAEYRYVAKSFKSMKNVIWTFIEGLKTALTADQEADNQALAQLQRLENTAKTGNLDEIRYEVKVVVARLNSIINERRNRQNEQKDQLYSQLRELGDQLQEAREESARDPLTKLYNRVILDKELSRAIDMYRIFRQPSCLLMIDLDHFKTINDLYGHAVGDKTLTAVANALVMSFPRKTDTICRYGGEEFAIILPDTNLDIGLQMGERMLNSIRNMEIVHGEDVIHVTASVGISECGEDETPEKWLDRSDRALYQAKSNGRNRIAIGYHFHKNEMRKAG